MRFIQRTIDQNYFEALCDAGINEVMARIIAARPRHEHSDIKAIIDPKLAYLDSPFLMKGMDEAVERLIHALEKNEVIGIETDHDCDGQTSHAVIYSALFDFFNHPKDKIRSYIGHRMKEGYGLSESLAQRILNDDIRPTLLITADNGSADEPRIKKLKEQGVDVIVTDHHELPLEGPPPSAVVCLNPTQEDCDFPDPYIAGCMVAWLLMAATRHRLLGKGCQVRSLASLLDYVSVGTVADCVSLSRSINNRVVIQYGLSKIAQGVRPCWQSVLGLLRSPVLRSEDLGFLIGPMLNSDGRLGDAFGSVGFLLSKTTEEAQPMAQLLWSQNEERKKIQRDMTEEALAQGAQQVAEGRSSIVVFLPEGHAGIHGISASRLKERFGRPVIIFSPKLGEDDIITGSARSLDELHIKEVLDEVKAALPNVVQKYGGHRGAAGITILKSGLDAFSKMLEKKVLEAVDPQFIGPRVMTDGALDPQYCDLNFYDQLQTLEPFGREFEAPIFEMQGTVVMAKAVGADGSHLQLKLRLSDGRLIPAIFFSGVEFLNPDSITGQSLTLACALADNHFRGKRSLQLRVVSAG